MIYLTAWFLIGFACTIFMLYDHWKHGNDIDLSDVLFGAFLTAIGPVTVAVMIMSGAVSPVILKGRKK